MCLVWNFQGLGNLSAIQTRKELIGKKEPKLAFLMEIKMSVVRVLKLKHKLGLLHGVAIDSVGRGGGLALFWSNEVTVMLQSFSISHIDAIVKI